MVAYLLQAACGELRLSLGEVVIQAAFWADGKAQYFIQANGVITALLKKLCGAMHQSFAGRAHSQVWLIQSFKSLYVSVYDRRAIYHGANSRALYRALNIVRLE